MKTRHLIFIVLTGMSLIAVAPTGEKAGQADTREVGGEPRSTHAEVQAASFTSDADRLKKQ